MIYTPRNITGVHLPAGNSLRESVPSSSKCMFFLFSPEQLGGWFGEPRHVGSFCCRCDDFVPCSDRNVPHWRQHFVGWFGHVWSSVDIQMIQDVSKMYPATSAKCRGRGFFQQIQLPLGRSEPWKPSCREEVMEELSHWNYWIISLISMSISSISNIF